MTGAALQSAVPVASFKTGPPVADALPAAIVVVESVAEVRKQAPPFHHGCQTVFAGTRCTAEPFAFFYVEETVVALQAEYRLGNAASAVEDDIVQLGIGARAEAHSHVLASVLLEPWVNAGPLAIFSALEAVFSLQTVAKIAQEQGADGRFVVEVGRETLLVNIVARARRHLPFPTGWFYSTV